MTRNEFCILKVLKESSKPLWKKEIHRQISDILEKLPRDEAFSVQTVGRRVNDLFDEGLIHPVTVADKDTNRTLITAFELTEEGETVLEQQMERFLKEYVRSYVGKTLLHEDTDIADRKDFIRHTFCDRYDIPYDTVSDATTEDILCLLHSYYCDQTLAELLAEGERFDTLIDSVGEYSTELTKSLEQRKTLLET